MNAWRESNEHNGAFFFSRISTRNSQGLLSLKEINAAFNDYVEGGANAASTSTTSSLNATEALANAQARLRLHAPIRILFRWVMSG